MRVILQQEVEEMTWRGKGRTRSESGLCVGALYNASFPLLPYSGLLFDASRIFEDPHLFSPLPSEDLLSFLF